MSKPRTRFPTVGIYQVHGQICSTHFLCAADRRRYRFVMPARHVFPEAWLGDCWIVDQDGERNPGTDCSPVPFRLDVIGERVDTDPLEFDR